MIIKEIVIENFRNYNKQKIITNDKINFFIGENAQGKTNLMEAVYYLALGKSFRNNKDIELILFGKDYSRITAKLTNNSLKKDYIIDIFFDKEGNKQIKINGIKKQKRSELLGFIREIIFSPDDLKIIKGGPVERRKYLDLENSQLIKSYYGNLLKYKKILNHRNILLKEIKEKKQKNELLDVWDEQLIEEGSIIIQKRLEFLKKLVPKARKIQKEITQNNESLDITYNSVIIKNSMVEFKDIKKEFSKILEKSRQDEIKRGITLIGPHRDDLLFYIGNKELKTYGSQGQQRTAVLSIKIAELNLFHEITGDYPILLLDDVMSELDDKRKNYLLQIIRNNNIQTFITGTNSEIFKEVQDKEIFYVNKGNINNF